MRTLSTRLAFALIATASLLTPCAIRAQDAPQPVRLAPAHSVEVDGARLNYTSNVTAPDALTLVLLHGFGASLESWFDVHPLLAAKYPVVRLDLLGHGFSDKPANGDYTPQGHARQVTGAIEKLGLRRVVLVGHSMGGAMALLTYLDAQVAPRQFDVTALVLIASSGYAQKLPFFVETLRDPVTRFFSTLFPVEQRTRYTLEQLFADKSLVTRERVQRYAYFAALPGQHHALTQTALHIMPPDVEQLSAKIKHVRVPTLLLWGERDRTVPLENAHRFQRDIAGARLHILPHTGHMLPEERPIQVFDFIDNFINYLQQP